MQTRRDFMNTVPVTAGAFAIGGSFLTGSPLYAGEAAIVSAKPHKGHFDAEGEAPSKHTMEVLNQARKTVPMQGTRDFEEFNRLRNRFLSGAYELRNDIPTAATASSATPDTLRAIPAFWASSLR
jgi:alkyl sulfatase BDS1-like metallo-beta-lactamase superfamily hydrolase